LISATTQFSANGITAQDDKATKQVTIGPKIKIILFAFSGIIISLNNNFNKSAAD